MALISFLSLLDADSPGRGAHRFNRRNCERFVKLHPVLALLVDDIRLVESLFVAVDCGHSLTDLGNPHGDGVSR